MSGITFGEYLENIVENYYSEDKIAVGDIILSREAKNWLAQNNLRAPTTDATKALTTPTKYPNVLSVKALNKKGEVAYKLKKVKYSEKVPGGRSIKVGTDAYWAWEVQKAPSKSYTEDSCATPSKAQTILNQTLNLDGPTEAKAGNAIEKILKGKNAADENTSEKVEEIFGGIIKNPDKASLMASAFLRKYFKA